MEINEEVKEKVIQMWNNGNHIYEILRSMPYTQELNKKILNELRKDGTLKWRLKSKITSEKIKELYMKYQDIYEICKITGLSIGTIKSYLYSEKIKFRKKIFGKKTHEIIQMLKDGISISEISNQKDVSRQYVYYLRSQAGIKQKNKITADRLKKMYDNGMNVYEISEKVGLSVKTVLSYLYSLGIKNIHLKESCNKTLEILKMINENISVKEIAKKMNVSKAYVYNLRVNIKGKYPVEKPIIQYDTDGNFIKRFDSIKSASQALNISASNICSVCKKRIKSTSGYIFKYEKEII